ncbi:MAG: MBL fold metallo-hydrolase [Sedimenticola sp.]
MKILHHGAVTGVTGSCHELITDSSSSVLVDCGLFQGADDSRSDGAEIEFPLKRVAALLVTHCHLDHVGRIPHLIAEGFKGPIYCSEATAILLPLVLDDALRMGITRNRRLVAAFLELIDERLRPLPYNRWSEIALKKGSGSRLEIRLQPAGHILGSAYIECRISQEQKQTKVLFSGDLGAAYTPLLPAPKAPWSTDILVLESTYGNRLHEGRKSRRKRLKALVKRCFSDRGVILIPAFSIGRTQELLYELEEIIHRFGDQPAARGLAWDELEIVLDSPLAARFTDAYRKLKPYWDQEARSKVQRGRHPLAFSQLTTIDDHNTHLQAVAQLTQSAKPTIVIAGSGMCTGGRIVNYLKALLGDRRTDVLFVGYQAAGTPGRSIQKYGPGEGYVMLDGERVDIRAGVHTLSGYSAHGDQKNLVDFVKRMRRHPVEVRLVHGDVEAKRALKQKIEACCPGCLVVIPQD